MTKSLFLYAPKIIFDLFADVLYFLPWWYSRGLMHAGGKAWAFARDQERELAIMVWLQNIFKPLYDDYRWQNRVKSVILRIGQIILRVLILVFWLAVGFFGLTLYLLLPILTIWEIVYQFL